MLDELAVVPNDIVLVLVTGATLVVYPGDGDLAPILHWPGILTRLV